MNRIDGILEDERLLNNLLKIVNEKKKWIIIFEWISINCFSINIINYCKCI